MESRTESLKVYNNDPEARDNKTFVIFYVTTNQKIKLLVKEYLNYGVLTEKCINDLRHVSLAVLSNCDYILSWNFIHLVNIRTIDKIQLVNKLLGYADIKIIPPNMLIEKRILYMMQILITFTKQNICH